MQVSFVSHPGILFTPKNIMFEEGLDQTYLDDEPGEPGHVGQPGQGEWDQTMRRR